MLEILASTAEYPELDELSGLALRGLRQQFAGCAWPAGLAPARPVLLKASGLVLYTFSGTKINRSLAFLLKQMEVEFAFDDSQSSFGLAVAAPLLPALFEQLRLFADDVDFHLQEALARNPALLDFAKWAVPLPPHFQAAVLKERYFDFAGATDFLRDTELVLSGE